MSLLQDRSCHAANRAFVTLGFVCGEVASNDTAQRILDTFHITQDLLLELEQSGQHDQTITLLRSGQQLVDRQSSEWSTFVKQQIAGLQTAKLHQKTIEKLGDLLSNWKPTVESPDDFDQSLRALLHVVTLDPEHHAQQWASSGAVILPFRMRSLVLVLSGLAVISCNQRDDQSAFSGASFGASLELVA